MKKIKIGFLPTRRSIFSAPDAVKYANLTRERLEELGVEFVDITDINAEGLFYEEADREKIQEKFRNEKVKGIFMPHCNFGTEYVCARLAKEMNLPVLLWGPRDERPDEEGIRLRDSQCGLFATGKVLRRFRVPFTYMTNCRLTDPEFERGLRCFLAVCNVVDVFRHTRILQIAPRPFDFWSTMCNEGELLERFNIQLSPIPMPELTAEMKKVKEERSEVEKIVAYCKDKMCVKIKPEELENVAALKAAMKNLADKYGCNAIAIQCWNALQAGMDENRSFFADWTVRHPDNENGELLQHCGPWPLSVAQEKPVIGYPLAFEHPGAVEAQAKLGEMTLARFDGDNGEYSLLLGNAKGVEGPYTKGTYVWVEVENLKRLEARLVEGPYIHHCVGIHQDVVPVLYEACKYMGITPDLYDNKEEQVKAFLRGE